ncbi:putative membrane protein, partial [Bacteroides fragilis str. 1007-1-F 
MPNKGNIITIRRKNIGAPLLVGLVASITILFSS